MSIFSNCSLFAMIFFLNGCAESSKSKVHSADNDLEPQLPASKSSEKTVKEPVKEKAFDLQQEAIKIQKDLECIRGKTFLSNPSVAFQSMPDFKKFIDREFEKEFRTEKSKQFGYLLKGLRLVDKDVDLEGSLAQAVLDQAAAYYDPSTKGFYVVSEGLSGMMLSSVMAHELQHALQDQHTRLLENYSTDHFDSFDAEMAARFLVEGEATLVGNAWLVQHASSMFGFLTGFQGAICASEGSNPQMDIFWQSIEPLVDDFASMTRNDVLNPNPVVLMLTNFLVPGYSDSQESLKSLPVFHYYTLNLPYSKGERTAYAVLKRANWDWQIVNQLFQNPPKTTEAVLHPHKIGTTQEEFRKLRPLEPGKVALGWEKGRANRLGELGLFLWLVNHKVPEMEAFQAAEGWNGDVAVSYSKNGKYAGSWKIAWDSPRQALRFRRRLIEAFKFGFDSFQSPAKWEELLADSNAQRGAFAFAYVDGRGSIAWNKDEISMWWGF